MGGEGGDSELTLAVLRNASRSESGNERYWDVNKADKIKPSVDLTYETFDHWSIDRPFQ